MNSSAPTRRPDMTAEDILGGWFVVEVGGMPGFETAYLLPDGQELTGRIEDAGRWRGREAATRVASAAIEWWGEADYWIVANARLMSGVTA